MRKKNIIVTFLLVLGLISITLGVSVAFFNYTRTGNVNTVATGKIYFNTTQDGNISLTNIFPMSSEEINNVLETGNNVTINITGDTTYDKGVEYLVTAEDVNIEVNEKKIPLNLYITSTNNLGNNDDNYFDNRGSDTSLYKVLSGGVVYDGQYLLVGYIAPGQEGIEGNLNIKAYIDKDKIAITDTPEENIEWQQGRTVFSTSEWNSLNVSGTPLSFKIRVEANEGVWVDPYTTPNLMNYINFNRNAVNVKEIRFIHETPLRMQRRYDTSVGQESNGTKMDLTYQDTGKVLAWIEPVSVSPTGTNNELLNIKPKFLFDEEQEEGDVEQIDNETSYILYIASSGETKWVTGSSLLGGFTLVEKIVFENVDSSDVTSMSGMFSGMSKLKSVNINVLDTSNVENMGVLFGGNTSLTSIDLLGLGSNVLSSVSNMFLGCTNLKKINMSNFNFGRITDLSRNASPFYISSVGSDLNIENINLSGANMQNVVNLSYFFADSQTGYLSDFKTINMSGARLNKVTNMSRMFEGCDELEVLNLKNISVANVTDMSYMFSKCVGLTSIDLSGLGGDNLINIVNIFYECTNLKDINMSNFNFGLTESLNGQFYGLSNLMTINLSNANASSVTSMNNMFNGCTSLTNINMSNLNFGAVTSMSKLFSDCVSLTNINLRNMKMDNVSDIQQMFNNCTSLTQIDLSNFGSSKLGLVNNLFQGCVSLEEVILDNFKGKTLYAMFKGCNTEKIKLIGKNLSHITNVEYLFQNCSAIKNIDLSMLDTSGVESMQNMFINCTSLINLNIDNINTQKVKDMSGMFEGCSSIKNLNISFIDTSNVETMARMFSECTSLEYLNISNLGSTKLLTVSSIFSNCMELKKLNMSNFNFGNADGYTIFRHHNFEIIDLHNANMSSFSSFGDLFQGCNKVESINLSNINMDNIPFMSYMFENCINLKTIYVSNTWSTDNVTSSDGMFSGCTSLVGGNGTVFDSAKTDKTMAVIDTPTTPGYLTLAG